MLHYIIQTVAFQLFFLIIYDLFLKKETFFNWNRAYLLITAVLSFTIPFIKIDRFKNVMPQEFIIKLPEVIIGNIAKPKINSAALEPSVVTENALWSWEFIVYIGMGVAVLLFLFKILKLLLLLHKNPKIKRGNVFVVNLLNSNAAFSFFNYIFLGEQINATEKDAILKHELVHIKQSHTLDLLFFEVLRILFWFNPFIYMYQNRIVALHEFIADSYAVKHQNKSQYYQNLLSQVFDTQNISFINPFFKQSLIKKRIVMLQKSKSKQVNLFKYALLIPVVIGMLMYSSCEKQVETNQTDALGLSQYSYTIKEDQKMSEEAKAIKVKQDAFLDENRHYVRWIEYDAIKQEVAYSVHSSDEKAPKGFDEINGTRRDGSKIKAYYYADVENLPTNNDNQKQENDLLKLMEEYKKEVDVPYAMIDQVPLLPYCEDVVQDEQKKCVSMAVSMHVGKNFNTQIANENGLTGIQRINVIFIIDKEGNVTDVRSRAPNPALEAEAIRVVKTLPKFKPGINNGKPVNVPYSLPIVFQVSE